MIAIINTGENPSPVGLHNYRVQINDKLITTFSHRREAGLAECLRVAANAVERQCEEEKIQLYIDLRNQMKNIK